MTRTRLGFAALLLAGGALVGCHNNGNGPHYGGWGGCCSQGECHPGAMPAPPGGMPMTYPAAPGQPTYTVPGQPSYAVPGQPPAAPPDAHAQ